MRVQTKIGLLAALLLVAGCDPRQEFDQEAELAAVQQAVEDKQTHAPNNVGNREEGKRLAQERCAQCHGMDGVKASSGSPFIAGVEQDYLVRSLLAYRNGARKYKVMSTAIEGLTIAEIASISSYYASLDTEWKGAVASKESLAIVRDKAAFERGHQLVAACNSCHDKSGRNKGLLTPNLDGMPFEYFKPALKAYFNGERHNDVMELFRYSMSDAQIYEYGAYYASRIPQKAPTPTFGNPAAGKIAARACAGCHGYDGNSLNPYVPNLAGQSAEYLFKAIEDYRTGKRDNDLVRDLVVNLSKATIENLSAFYAMQEPQSQLHTKLSSLAKFDPIGDGSKIAKACDSCHGENGNSTEPGVPSLAGMDVKYFVRASIAYQHGLRDHKAMREFVSFYSDSDLEKVAFFYAMQEPVTRQVEDKELVALGEKLSDACTMCHGRKGISSDPAKVPSLAGQDINYLLEATRAYEKGGRQHDGMANASAEITEPDLIKVAAYFAAQTPKAATTYPPEDPALIVRERCDRCHGERGYSTMPGVPRLAGQVEPYIVLAMKEYQDGIRNDSAMVAMASVMSLNEIKAVAAYYARQ